MATPIRSAQIELQRNNKGQIYSPIRKRWLVETPEERVRQEYVTVLVNEYGYDLEQLAEEISTTGRGSGDARADLLVWRTQQDRQDDKTALIVVECKSDNVAIDPTVYWQGANYAQYERARFFVTHNNRETKYWKVDLDRRMPNYDEIENIPPAQASDQDIDRLMARLKVFKEDEFAKLLRECHDVIRNREKLDPAAAFDEIAKILFIKVDVERRLRAGKARQNLFTAAFLDEQLGYFTDPVKNLFDQTKKDYAADRIFEPGETINLKFNTVREIVRLLERYNLSDTSEDIKGIAFEKFLGRTFRGEIGQFFTPRSIVEFMIRMVEPQEGDVICDPASGSGGFLIRFFEIVRQQILADADRAYQAYKAEIEGQGLAEAEAARLLRVKYDEIQQDVDPQRKGSRLWQLANRCIYGTDANERMARTSKMNMIMHGDGHGGVHHHDGFVNVNGIFEGRFDIVLTNPPFGAAVEAGKEGATEGDMILESEVRVSEDDYARYVADYGNAYVEAQARVRAAVGKPVSSLFELPKKDQTKVKTEILFLERCLALLRPGGRIGIVLPEGVFNNPTLAYVREFCEDRALIRAVVSLPQETFYSSKASVKASLLFLQKFTEAEQAQYNRLRSEAEAERTAVCAEELAELTRAIDAPPLVQADFLNGVEKPTPQQKAAASEQARQANAERTAKRVAAQKRKKELEAQIKREGRALLKERFDYPIFMYEAEKVGITATGEEDLNELYPNDRQPAGLEATCLELYRQFRTEPDRFFVTSPAA